MKLLSPVTVDRVGAIASVICLVHCMATPLVVALLPFAASDGFESWTLRVLVLMATTSAVIALVKRHLAPVVPFAAGLALLALGRASAATPWLEHLSTSLAAVALIVTHLLSLRRERRAGPVHL
ncbi:MAG: MerC domain-containing protein [Nannocystaceae bacterium]